MVINRCGFKPANVPSVALNNTCMAYLAYNPPNELPTILNRVNDGLAFTNCTISDAKSSPPTAKPRKLFKRSLATDFNTFTPRFSSCEAK